MYWQDICSFDNSEIREVLSIYQ